VLRSSPSLKANFEGEIIVARPIWKGHVSFGLVSVPVTLFGAEERNDISLHLLDSRDTARVRYERINEQTGEEVPWNKIIRGYEYADGNYVLLKEGELERAHAELTKTIEIEQFIEADEIGIPYFEKPYYLLPGKGGEKGYVLLREAMKQTGRVGIAQVVIRARGHLAVLLPHEDGLVLELLRFPQEMRSFSDLELPESVKGKGHVKANELTLARNLIEGMAGKWEPDKYHDDYRDALMALIQKRIKAGDTEASSEEQDEAEEPPPTVNFMEMLKKSLASKKPAKKRAKVKAKAASARKKPRKKKAG